MRRPPLITFLTFNRLGNSCISLQSLLQVKDDFELYIIDNGSRDKSWDYIQSINDPRIKEKKRFDDNIGHIVINYALLNRKPDQDWINVEFDAHIHDKNFITTFNRVHEIFPECGSLSGTLVDPVASPGTYLYALDRIKEDPTLLMERQGFQVYRSPSMGFCYYVPYEIMNHLGYLDELSYGADIDLNGRITQRLNKSTAYILNLKCSMISFGGLCSLCLAYGTFCSGNNLCLKTYDRTTTKFFARRADTIKKHLDRRLGNRLSTRCETIFSPIPLSEENRKIILENMEVFKNCYKEFLTSIGMS